MVELEYFLVIMQFVIRRPINQMIMINGLGG